MLVNFLEQWQKKTFLREVKAVCTSLEKYMKRVNVYARLLNIDNQTVKTYNKRAKASFIQGE